MASGTLSSPFSIIVGDHRRLDRAGADRVDAFYGAYRVDDGGRTFAVTVQSSAVRNLIGQRLTRVFRVTGDRLVLTPTDPAEGWRVTYKRAKGS